MTVKDLHWAGPFQLLIPEQHFGLLFIQPSPALPHYAPGDRVPDPDYMLGTVYYLVQAVLVTGWLRGELVFSIHHVFTSCC